MDLSKYELPSTIEVDGNLYEIHTDTQHIFSLIKILKQNKIQPNDIDFVFKNRIPKNKAIALQELIAFIYPKRELPKQIDEKTDCIILDYEIDAELIFSAFMEQYKINLISEHLHWHIFQALLFGLQDTKLNKVMEYRSYVINANDSNEYKNAMLKLKRQWTIDEPITEEEQKAIDKFDRLLNARRQ